MRQGRYIALGGMEMAEREVGEGVRALEKQRGTQISHCCGCQVEMLESYLRSLGTSCPISLTAVVSWRIWELQIDRSIETSFIGENTKLGHPANASPASRPATKHLRRRRSPCSTTMRTTPEKYVGYIYGLRSAPSH